MNEWSRRAFLGGLVGTGATTLAGVEGPSAAAPPGLETTKIRLTQLPDICSGTVLIVAQALLRTEGFADVEPVKKASGPESVTAVARGEVDFTVTAAPGVVHRIAAGEPLVLLAGIHVGCIELFGSERVRSLADLKGRRVAVTTLDSSRHLLTAAMVSHVGLDPRRDIEWVTHPAPESIRMFARGEIDAFVAFPPEPQELRAKRIGRVVVNTTIDKPWSQYFCCMVVGNREFVRRNPVATKRALRALLKATTVCGVEPERAVRLWADKGYTTGADYALQTLKELPYGQWRGYNPEDTVRFLALRLHEAGLIKSTPQKVLAEGTDWRFLNELRKELKG